MNIFKKLNYTILGVAAFLSITGVLFVFEASGSIVLLIEQFSFGFFGFIAMLFFSKIGYQNLKRISVPFLLISLVLLGAVLIPGLGLKINGARRWLDLRLFSFQPSEIAKLSLIIFFAHWFEGEEKERTIAFLLLILFVFSLILLEPDMGTALIILIISLSMFFISKSTDLRKFFLVFPAVVLLTFIFINISPYRRARITTFLNLNEKNSGANYHANQALISVGSGGLFGVGFGKSKQKYSYLPESSSDSIFGIIAEEVGFLGSMIVVAVYLLFLFQAFKIVLQTQENFGKFLAFGIFMFFAAQTLLNISSMLVITPLTGVPLPFISSGGSALLIQFIAVGILLSINQKVKYKKSL